MKQSPQLPFSRYKHFGAFDSPEGSISAEVMMLQNLPPLPFSVMASLFAPKVAKPAITATLR